MVVIFLLLTLASGMYYSYHNKSTTLRTYAIGDKAFSTPTLIATVLATTYGGGTLIRAIEQVYSSGLYWIILMILSGLNLWIVSLVAIRMGPFMKHLSLPETIGSIYGQYARMITAISAICSATAVIAIQIKAISMTMSSIVTYNPHIIAVLATLILIFYSTLGGIRSVTCTDVLQFITFTIIIPLLAWFMFLKTEKSILDIINFIQHKEKFNFNNLLHANTKLISLLFLSLSYLIGYTKEPTIIQRIYMASGPNQAYKVFKISTICHYLIKILIILISLFVFAKDLNLPLNKVWNYIPTHVPPVLNGCIAISLLAMTMSTADSHLNNCAVIASYDIIQKIIPKKLHPINHLKIAKWSTLIIGLLAMMLTFYSNNLLSLLKFSLDFSIPITVAPFLLAVFGFRGSPRTALIGMVTGITTIIAWNTYIQPKTGIDGSFVAMLANGLAMLSAHYLLKQPPSAGWVGPDTNFKQMQQEKARRSEERKQAIKNGWANRKATLGKIKPSYNILVCIGFYLAITSLMAHFIAPIYNNSFWLILQLFVAAFFIGYPFIHAIAKTTRGIPTGLGWLIGLVVYFPLNLFWHCSHSVDPIFTLSLSFTHFAIILLTLPLYLAIPIITVTLLLTIYPISICLSHTLLSSLLPLLIIGLLLLAIIIYLKIQQGNLTRQNLYLKNQQQIRSSQQLKSSLYDAALVPSNQGSVRKGYGFILNQVVRKVEEFISFLDKDTPLFKEDFQSIMNKFYDWVTYFNRREKAKEHALLQPNKITLDKLMREVEITLSQEINDPPKLLVETIETPDKQPCTYIVCDINQVVYSLVKAILRVGRLEGPNALIVRIQLYSTTLRFKQSDAIDNSRPSFVYFQSIAMVISQSATSSEVMPTVKSCYDELHDMDPKISKNAAPSIDLEQDTIASMVHAHYGYLKIYKDEKQPTMLLVLPRDVTDIRDKMTVKLPIGCLTSEAPLSPQEQADSMMALMKFHDHVCKYLSKETPIDIKIISGLLLLLRQYFGFKRHASGQLFYVRSVGIAQIVVDWVFHSPKVIYASLLYELVRRTCLPLSYIKEHYNLGVYAFVSNLVKIDKRQELDDPSLLCIQNRLEQALKEDHVQLSVLFIKLAERLYDLRHASGYIYLTEVQHMAQETFTIDVQIANKYLGTEIATALDIAAQEALNLCNDTSKSKENHIDF
ncbi:MULTISPECIES: sodium:solute symporter family protein [unclassified Candidatus Cardinium]|uniref:sodium:solute symporter family protein n=1 Tax=unclassified Candidatus Cardinium TaxID=2641185 RepID=UPI001FB44387|nr:MULTISPECIES: sodium:solute symporter family protein [unclassified Candidatus Cardinium]